MNWENDGRINDGRITEGHEGHSPAKPKPNFRPRPPRRRPRWGIDDEEEDEDEKITAS